MKAHDVIYLVLFGVISMHATTLCSQNQQSEPSPQKESVMIGKKYIGAEDLGMHHFFSAIVGKSYLLEAFSTSGKEFDAKHIHVFLVETKGDMEERTIVDELIFDRNTSDSFSYVPIYDRLSNSKKEYFARFASENNLFVLKEIYECDIERKKILTRQPAPGMQIELEDF
jgi:hypothetical protein